MLDIKAHLVMDPLMSMDHQAEFFEGAVGTTQLLAADPPIAVEMNRSIATATWVSGQLQISKSSAENHNPPPRNLEISKGARN